MATVLGTLVVKLQAKTADFNRKLAKAEQRAGKAGSKFATIGKLAAAGVGAIALVKIAQIGITAIQSASKFEQGMAKVRAVSGATGKDFDKLRATALKLAVQTQFTATEAAGAMQLMSQAGFTVKETTQALGNVLNLAAATFVDLGTATDIASSTLRGFQLDASDMGRVSDVLAKAMTSTNTTLMDLGESLKVAAPIANTLGISLENTTAAVGLLGNVGIKGTLAATALKRGLVSLVKPTGQAAATIKDLGLKTRDSQGKMQNFTGIMRELERTGADTEDIISIFGARAGPVLAALLGQGSDAIKEMTEKLEEAQGTTDDMAKIQLDTLEGKIKLMNSAIEKAAIAWGDEFLPALKKTIPVLTKIIEGIGDLASIAGALLKGGKTGLIIELAKRASVPPKETSSKSRSGIAADIFEQMDKEREKEARKREIEAAKEKRAKDKLIEANKKAAKAAGKLAEAAQKAADKLLMKLVDELPKASGQITAGGVRDRLKMFKRQRFASQGIDAIAEAAFAGQKSLGELSESATSLDAFIDQKLAQTIRSVDAAVSNAFGPRLGEIMSSGLAGAFAVLVPILKGAGERTSAVFEGAAKGFEAGGVVGGIVGAVAGLASTTDAFTEILRLIDQSLVSAQGKLQRVIEPLTDLFQALFVFGEIITTTALAFTEFSTVVDLFKGVVELVVETLNFVSKGIVTAFNFVIDHFIKVVERLTFGKTERKLRRSLEKLKINFDEINDSFKKIEEVDAPKAADSLSNLADAANDVTEQLTNVPSGFKVALRRFQSIVGEPPTPTSLTDTQGVMSGGGTTFFIENVQVGDTKTFLSDLEQEAESRNFQTTATSVTKKTPFAVPRDGA